MHCFIGTRRFRLLLWSGEVLILARKYTALSNKATSICSWFLSNRNFCVALHNLITHSLFWISLLRFALCVFLKTLNKKKITSKWCWALRVRMTEIEKTKKKKLQTKLATFWEKKCVYEKCKKIDLIWLSRFQGVSNANLCRLRNLANAQSGFEIVVVYRTTTCMPLIPLSLSHSPTRMLHTAHFIQFRL